MSVGDVNTKLIMICIFIYDLANLSDVPVLFWV